MKTHISLIAIFVLFGVLVVAMVFNILYSLVTNSQFNTPIKSKEGFIYRVYKIDSCEYIYYDKSLTHKGNCTNIIHKLK